MIDRQVQKDEGSKSILDTDSLRFLRDRDPDFLQKLFYEINPYLVRICVSNRMEGDDVKELIHQTWDKFFSNLDQFEGRSQIRTFICGILLNKIREHRRFQKRMVPEEDVFHLLDEAFTEDGWWKTAPQDPLRIFELKQSTGFVKECLEGLSEQQVTAFIMKEVQEEELEDICNVLGVTISHLRVLIFRAKDKLRKCLEGKVSTEKALM